MTKQQQHIDPCSEATGAFHYNKGNGGSRMKRLIKALVPTLAGIVLATSMVLVLRSGQAGAVTAPNQTQVINSGLAYIKAQQQPDGGIAGFSGTSDPDTTARSVLAFTATSKPLGEVVSADGNNMLGYLSTQAITFTHDTTGTLFPGRAGELLAAVATAGEDPTTFGGMDLTKELEASFQADTGAYSTTAKQDYSSGAASDLNQAWAILGLSLAKQSVPEAASQYLVKSQAADGSWGTGDPDTTALVVTALLASHNLTPQDTASQKAIGFFHATQLDSAGWRPSWDSDPLNADSTGWILQALASAGEDPRSPSWTKNNTNPVDALLALAKPDGTIGGTNANTYSTAEAIIGLSGVSLDSIEAAQAGHRAGLAVFSGDNSVFTECISFTGSSITGLQLLQRSSLAIETATNPSQGTVVCKIGQIGDSSNNCFGSMPNYWAYWELGKDGWQYSAVGADRSQVSDGGVYAWTWGTGNPPPVLSYQNICEGVAFTLPTTLASTLPATSSPQPRTTSLATETVQPTSTPTAVGTGTSNYEIYLAILLAVVLLVVYVIRSRNR